MGFSSEIYLTEDKITKESWNKLIKKISDYNGYLKKWSLIIKLDNNQIKYIIESKIKLPVNIDNIKQFVLKETDKTTITTKNLSLPIILPIGINIPEIINYSIIKKYGNLKSIKIEFRKINEDKILSNTYLYLEKDNILIKTKLLLAIPDSLLDIDYSITKYLSYKKVPKYFEILKALPILKDNNYNSLFEINPFPYQDKLLYLEHNKIDFNKHSLVLGASGTGKSMFISSLIKNIKESHKNYKIVVIDPHASLINDIGGISTNIDFKTLLSSINLFSASTNDVISNTELTLSLFKSLIKDQYNSKVERVLRHSLYLLLKKNIFNFDSLNLILNDITYRTELLKDNDIPSSVKNFFLTDFNEIKTKYYSEAISPIISFIDEITMIPVFNNNIDKNLENTINENAITLFSLDRTYLGDKITKTISGLIMQQLFTLICKRTFDEHIIFIIDEVSIIENPIINRYLSESRKYNSSVIIASQYFNQVSNNLQNAMFSNIINYYIFRISQNDANILVDNLDIKIPSDKGKSSAELKESKINILSNLNNRECILRISSNNNLIPVFKAKTLDFIPIPPINKIESKEIVKEEQIKTFSNNIFDIGTTNFKDILKSTSTRKEEI